VASDAGREGGEGPHEKRKEEGRSERNGGTNNDKEWTKTMKSKRK
jgi:hypothetical protein